jgi:hypothetical protein
MEFEDRKGKNGGGKMVEKWENGVSSVDIPMSILN